jgi:hypothetical protein
MTGAPRRVHINYRASHRQHIDFYAFPIRNVNAVLHRSNGVIWILTSE